MFNEYCDSQLHYIEHAEFIYWYMWVLFVNDHAEIIIAILVII